MELDREPDPEQMFDRMIDDFLAENIIAIQKVAEEEARANAKKSRRWTRYIAFIFFCIIMVVGKNWDTAGDTNNFVPSATSVHAEETTAPERPTVMRSVGKRALYAPDGQPQTRVSLLEGKCDADVPTEVCEKLPEDPASLNKDGKVQVFTASPWKPIAPNTVSRRTQHEVWNGDALRISWELESRDLNQESASE